MLNGIDIRSSSNSNVVAGNFIGTDASGSVALGNGTTGLQIGGASFNRIGTNADGVSDAAERNIVSGNLIEGISISGDQNVVAGNYIGTNVSGTLAVPNGTGTVTGQGVRLDLGAQANLVGANGDGVLDAVERNVISGNIGSGVHLIGSGTNNNVVAGNFIGTDATCTSAVPNTRFGVRIQQSAAANLIGTDGDGLADAAERNLISGNARAGIRIEDLGTDRNVVAGN